MLCRHDDIVGALQCGATRARYALASSNDETRDVERRRRFLILRSNPSRQETGCLRSLLAKNGDSPRNHSNRLGTWTESKAERSSWQRPRRSE
jgi:hypothetical protein